MRKVSLLLKDKAISSLRRATAAFNGIDDDGRQTAVLLHLQHAFEMLLKAALREKNVKVFDSRTGRSIGFEKCLNLASEHLGLRAEQVGVLRAIDALRDDEQHYLSELTEALLYVHARGAVTLFDDILHEVFGARLADHLPERVLPISTSPPQDIQVLIGEQFNQVKELLRPGKRRRVEARAKIRALLAMEGHLSEEEAPVSERDVNRVVRGMREGKQLSEVFPRLGRVGTEFSYDGPTLKVRFVRGGGAPVTFIAADDPREAAAVREVDLQRKYYISKPELAERLGLSGPRALALRRHLGIDGDEDCVHVFDFDSQKHYRYSDNALRKMRKALESVDMDEVWEEHGPRPGRQR
jgi:hypothetical protein